MLKQYSLKEFLKMTAPQKAKLYAKDRNQFNKLKASLDSTYNKETDEDALRELTKSPNAKSKGE